jgi:hypothetical protein
LEIVKQRADAIVLLLLVVVQFPLQIFLGELNMLVAIQSGDFVQFFGGPFEVTTTGQPSGRFDEVLCGENENQAGDCGDHEAPEPVTGGPKDQRQDYHADWPRQKLFHRYLGAVVTGKIKKWLQSKNKSDKWTLAYSFAVSRAIINGAWKIETDVMLAKNVPRANIK